MCAFAERSAPNPVADPMPPPSSPRLLPFLVLAAALFAALVVVGYIVGIGSDVALRPCDASLPSPAVDARNAGPRTDVVGASDAHSRAAGLSVDVDTDARRSAGATLRGRVLDAAGLPVAGMAVLLGEQPPIEVPLLPRRARPPKTERVEADAAGAFVFAGLAAGTWTLRCHELPSCAEVCTLAVGEVREVELRMPSDHAIVTGVLRRGGVTRDDFHIEVLRGKSQLSTNACSKAGLTTMLAAGTYELRTWMPALGPSAWYSRHTLVVPPGVPRVHFDYEVGGTDIEVVVRGTAVVGRDEVGIDVNGAGLDNAADVYTAHASKVGETTRFVLPPGNWRIAASGPGIAALPEHRVGIDVGTPPIRIEHMAVPGANVRLELCDVHGRRFTPAPELMPVLRAAGMERPCMLGANGKRGQPIVYTSVPLGAATLGFEDREADGVRTFLPFAPQAALDVVVGTEGAVVPLTVQRRAFVDLRACEASGREDFAACILVFAGTVRVRGRDDPAAQRWAGWLPPGEYRVAIERAGVTRERIVTVGETDLTLRLRP